MKSVLQEWVMELPLRQQGVLILALRGPDGARKEDVAKPLVRTLRGLVMVSGREGKPMAPGTHWRDDTFMNTRDIDADERWYPIVNAFFASIDQYNLHFFQHFIHAFAVVGIGHPDEMYRARAWYVYTRGCHALHVYPECADDINLRLRDGVREEHDT